MSVRTVDSRGRRCPQPVIDLASAARDQPEGTLLDLLTTDPASRLDVPAWCRMRGHEVVSTSSDGEVLRITVRLRQSRGAAPD